MTAYATNTSVPVERSKAELERLLGRFGADQFLAGWDQEAHHVGFRIGGRMVRLTLPMPAADDPTITHTAGGQRRSASAQATERDKEIRRRWRSLVLVVKAKLTAVADGISTIEREFLADVVLADGSTFGSWARPQLEAVYQSGEMPALLPGSSKELRP